MLCKVIQNFQDIYSICFAQKNLLCIDSILWDNPVRLKEYKNQNGQVKLQFRLMIKLKEAGNIHPMIL